MKKKTRILALAGIVLLLAMYASTMIFALMDSPMARGLFMGSLFCTVAVPVILYGMILAAKVLRGRGMASRENDGPAPGERREETPSGRETRMEDSAEDLPEDEETARSDSPE